MSHLISFNCTEVRPQSAFIIGFHSSLMFCLFCACAKGRFSTKTQFYDLVRFISKDSVCTKFWSQLVHLVKLRTRNTFFFLKMAKYPCLLSPESNHQHLIFRNFSGYINCWPTGQGLAYEKENFFPQSIPFYEVNLIIWMDAKSIYLTYRILIYWIILSHLLFLNKKPSLEKIQSQGESRYFYFHKYL